MTLQCWMLLIRGMRQNRRILILLTRILTLTSVGSQDHKQDRIGTGQSHPPTISLQTKEKAKVKRVRNLPATENVAKMTGSRMNADTTKLDQVRVHFSLTTPVATVEKQDIGAMSVPPLSMVGTLPLLLPDRYRMVGHSALQLRELSSLPELLLQRQSKHQVQKHQHQQRQQKV